MASPELQEVLQLIAERPRPLVNPTQQQIRDAMEDRSFPATEAATVTPVEANGVPGEWVTVAESDQNRRVLYFHGGGYVYGSPITRAMALSYIGDADPADPLISPLYADFTGLPPLLLQVGEPEPGRPDTEKVSERARAAGVDATAEIWPEMPHVWHMFAPTLPEGQEAIDRIGEFINQHA